MTTNKAAALRAARQQRIASRQSVRSASEGPKSENKSPDVSSTSAPPAAAPASAVPAAFTASVVDPNTVPRTATVDLLLYGENTENPHWVVFANGRPAAEIRLEDQEEPTKVAKLFVTEKYAEGVKDAARSFDFAEVLAGVRARTYVATVSGSEEYKRIEASVKEAAKADVKKAKAALRDDALNMLNLVVVAQTKNFIGENALKSEMFNRMKDLGVSDRQAVAAIEAAYQAKAPEFFEACFKQAFKWMDLQPEALAELEEQIKGMPHRTPVVADAEEIPSARSAIHNIPLETRNASFAGEEDDRASLRETLSFRKRLHTR